MVHYICDCFIKYIRHLKKNVKNKAKVEGSIYNAYIVEEASTFCSHYFEPHMNSRFQQVPRNDDGGHVEEVEGNLSIFAYPSQPYGRSNKRRLKYREILAAHTYILLNCTKVVPFLK